LQQSGHPREPLEPAWLDYNAIEFKHPGALWAVANSSAGALNLKRQSIR